MTQPSIAFQVNAQALGQVPTGIGLVVLMLGTCSGGTPNTLYSYAGTASATQAASDLGIGPLSEAVQYQLSKSNTQIWVMPVTPTQVAMPTTPVHTGTGTGTFGITANANGGTSTWDSGKWVVKIINGAATVAATTFQYSKDGGTTWSPTLSAAASVAIEAGLSFQFSVSSTVFVTGDTYTFTSYEQGYSTANLAAAFTAAFTPNNAYQMVHVVGSDMGTTDPVTDAAQATAYAARVVQAEASIAAQATRIRFVDCFVDSPRVADNGTSDNLIITDFTSVVASDVSATGGMQTQANLLSYGFQVPRSVAWCFVAKSRIVDLAQTTWARNVPIDTNILSIDTDSAVRPALDAANFATLTTMPGLAGFYGCRAPTLATGGSDLNTIEANNVMNLAKTTAYAALAPQLGSTVIVDGSTGYITQASALGIEKTVNRQLRAVMTATGGVQRASKVTFTVTRTNNILSTKQLIGVLAIVPLGYVQTILVPISFSNPTVVVA